MNKQFRRGKQLVTLIIAIMLMMNGLSFWFSRALLLSWYKETTGHFSEIKMAAANVQQINVDQVQHLLNYFVQIDQRDFLAVQGTSYAFLILCSVILYLGYSWIRWLWGVTWLVQGISGLLIANLLMTHFGLWTNLVLFGLFTSFLYLMCALCLLCLPSIRTYMRAMRR